MQASIFKLTVHYGGMHTELPKNLISFWIFYLALLVAALLHTNAPGLS